MYKRFFFLLLAFLMISVTSTSAQKLDRKLAKRMIIKAAADTPEQLKIRVGTFRSTTYNLFFTTEDGKGWQAGSASWAVLLALDTLGYLTTENVGTKYVANLKGFCPHYKISLTEKGKSIFSKEDDDVWSVILAYPKIDVTGITFDGARTTANVECYKHYDLTDAGKKIVSLCSNCNLIPREGNGNVVFRLYDDGWRVQK